MTMRTRIRVGISFTLLFSVSLGLLTASCSIGGCSILALSIWPIPAIAVGISLLIGLALVPLGIWAARTGLKNFYTYGLALWVLFATLTVFAFRRIDSFLEWEVGAGIIALVILGMIPNRG